MAERPTILFVGVYGSEADAKADYEVVKSLHDGGVVGFYDAAVITKDANGKVRVSKDETSTRHGAWAGLAVGALAGIVFPPSVLAAGAVGAGTGGLIGHLTRGMSRSDMKEIGDALDAGDASLVVVGESRLEEQLQRELARATRTVEKEIDADAGETRKELDAARG